MQLAPLTCAVRGTLWLTVFLSLSFVSCERPEKRPPRTASPQTYTDPAKAGLANGHVYQEMLDYRSSTRKEYNACNFDELERLANEARSTRATFGNGGWKLVQFYDSFGLWPDEPESAWQAHAAAHKKWVAAKPTSITARVAWMNFLVEYAWHARGGGYASTVTNAGWQLFHDRLAEAHQVLDDSKKLDAKCPEWWDVGMTLGRGEGWPRVMFERFYTAAKASEPKFWGFDAQRCEYLATKWYGQEGNWEAASEEAAAAADGLGLEVYARCVWNRSGDYDNVFRQSRADWAKTQAGYELMRVRYPESMEIASAYCRLACTAGDRRTAKKLFEAMGNEVFAWYWADKEALDRARVWAAAPD